MDQLGAYLLGTAFWLFIGVCAVAGIVADYKRRRLGIEVVRSAIERGHQLDPALIEKLTKSPHDQSTPIDPVHLKLGGIITIAAGIGLCPLSLLVGIVAPRVLYPGLGVGVLAIFVGAGLLLGARVVARAQQQVRAGSPGP
jgi:hypothetical protein